MTMISHRMGKENEKYLNSGDFLNFVMTYETKEDNIKNITKCRFEGGKKAT